MATLLQDIYKVKFTSDCSQWKTSILVQQFSKLKMF